MSDTRPDFSMETKTGTRLGVGTADDLARSVALYVSKPKSRLTPTEARQLARELLERAGEDDALDQPTEHPRDGTERLCRALYGRAPKPSDYLGGSGAKMLHDAADHVADYRAQAQIYRNALVDIGSALPSVDREQMRRIAQDACSEGWTHAHHDLTSDSDTLRAQPDPLHPNGRCTCGGEGRCEWCLSVETEVATEIDPTPIEDRISQWCSGDAQTIYEPLDLLCEAEQELRRLRKEHRQAVAAALTVAIDRCQGLITDITDITGRRS